jgi:hypothetical protein
LKAGSVWVLSIGVLLAACTRTVAPAQPISTETPIPSPTETESPTQLPTGTFTPDFTATTTATATPDTRPLPREWSSWPIVPFPSPRVREIYAQGLVLGMTPNTYSVVGDCQSEPEVFLGVYSTDWYSLPADEQYLQETIAIFRSSLEHDSVAVRDGLSAPSVLDPLWTDTERCDPTESPLTCELRIYHPMIVFVNLGTNWRADASEEAYKGYLVQIVDQLIAAGAILILTTKADNVEGNHRINRVTAEVAFAYDIPLMNYWLASDRIPNHGLDMEREPPGVYLSPDTWGLRSYYALRTLDAVWRYVTTGTE